MQRVRKNFSPLNPLKLSTYITHTHTHTHTHIYIYIYIYIYIVTWSVLETSFGFLLRFIFDFTNRHYNYFYNVRSSLPCWFLVLVGSLIAGFLVAALIWLLWSPLTLRLWSTPLISFDVASLIGSFDLLWRCFSDRLLWSALTLRLRSTSLISSWRCVSDRLLWSPPDAESLVGSFDILWRCVSGRLLWSALTVEIYPVK
jgi:hypothetical protein